MRSGFVESEHLVDVAVVDAKGELVAAAGEPFRAAAFRSCSKPIQARVCLESGWEPDEPSLAIACGSHNAEPEHVDQVSEILRAAGLRPDHLRCPADVPADPTAALRATMRSPVYHYCSGKHAAMLATCAINGWPLDTYCAPEHPLQERIRARMQALLGADASVLVDGCGVPTFVGSLAVLARSFLAMDDGGPESRAMRAHPFLVGGTDLVDTDVMTIAPHILMKYGAEGLVCASANGYGIALKSRDGISARSRGPATVLVLRSLGLLDDEQVGLLVHHAEPVVWGGGEAVGRAVATGCIEGVGA